MTSSFQDVLLLRARSHPERQAFTFLRDGADEEASLSYGALDRRARTIAAELQIRLQPGDRAMLLYPPGLNYIEAFFGCLYAGVIAIPVYPPSLRRLDRLLTIWNDAQPKAILTTEKTQASVKQWAEYAPGAQDLHWLATDSLPDTGAERWREIQSGAKTVAFLQYTSGSTAAPKGVIVSHGNLLHNEKIIQERFQTSANDIILGWLPLYHDMGLIGNVLHSLYIGARCILLSPLDFLRRPACWLQAISRYRATTSGGPNFAYSLCVQRIGPEQRATLDLSSWRLAFNGAEPIHSETLEDFARTFAECGFQREAFFPCYGLAEATLFVSGGGRPFSQALCRFESSALEQGVGLDSPDKEGGRLLVGCGQVPDGQTVAIVHPEKLTRCEPGHVGEIWVSGPSVTQGYWQKPEATEQAFQARMADTHEGPFLRTGDLGFLREGELFITGRLKDLIIIRGRNHYPQDIERTVEKSHSALRPGCGVAFSIPVDNEERLVVLYEVSGSREQPDVEEIASTVRRAVSEVHELQVHAVALLPAGSILKTSSGKLQRRASRAGFLKGTLPLMGCSISKNESQGPLETATLPIPANLLASSPEQQQQQLEADLRQHIAALLRTAPAQIDSQQPLNALGLDSLSAVELAHQLETRLGVSLSVADLLQGTSLAELAAALLDQRQHLTTRPPSAPPNVSPSSDIFNLSHGQQGLWFLQQLEPENTAYTIARAVRIHSALAISELRRAFQKLVDRHPALRTSFTSHQGIPRQQVAEHREVFFEEVESAAWSETDVERFIDKAAHRPFDLERDALLRVTLLKRAPQEHILLLCVHHIIADFWTLALWARELEELYRAELLRTNAALPPLTVRYADYVEWQARRMEGPDAEALGAWWQQRLALVPTTLDLPVHPLRDTAPSTEGRSRQLWLDAELTQALTAMGREHGATLYMTLLAAFQALLYRYGGQERFLIGSPTAGRSRAEWRQVAGYFVNTLVLRSDFAGSPSFVELLARVRQEVLETLAHQDLPYSLLVQRHQPERTTAGSSLFRAMFVLQSDLPSGAEGLAALSLGEAGAHMQLGNLTLESVRMGRRVPQCDLLLMAAMADKGLLMSLEYDAALFDDTTIRRMLEHLEVLLRAIVAHPRRQLAQLPMITEAERHQVLVEWNDTRRPPSDEWLAHQLFEQRVRHAPESLALLTEERSFDYQTLNRRANQLARYLRHIGVRIGERIGLCLDRSEEMLISLLATWKVGAAYVPLDPGYPMERLRFMLEEASVSLVLTQQRQLARLPPGPHRTLCVDEKAAEFADEKDGNLELPLTPDALAYIIFTSGSTGRPKGVMVEHRSVANFFLGCQETFGIGAGTRVFQFTTLNFDVFIAELCCTLLTGATWILTGKAGLLLGEELVSLLRRWEVQVLFAPPSALAALTGELLPTLTHIISAGEACPPALARQLGTGRRFFNAYGPTETTVYCTVAEYSPTREDMPIGRPMANVRVYVLDEWHRPTPIGVAGELYVGGDGVARGYLNRPDLTAERFVPDPFSSQPGARLYRTGDRVRYQQEGHLDFLGRLDHQVKIRGLRIEPGEVDVLLREYHEVREAVTVARVGVAGDARLVSYVVPRAFSDTLPSRLHAHLREHLPAYMQPAAIVLLESLPMTPNGKVDRRALPEPDWQRLVPGQAYEPPRGPIEETLAAIWSWALGVQHVGARDDFFALGGHSLLATQVVSRIRETFHVDLTLREFFATPTLSALAARVGQRRRGDRYREPPPLQRVDRSQPPALSSAQWRLWFLDRLVPDSRAHGMFQALHLTGTLDATALERSMDEVLRRHEVLRTTFPMVDGQPVQAIAAHSPRALPQVNLSSLAEHERETRMLELAHEEARRGFDLALGPLLRVILVKLGPTNHVLLVHMHHIVGDDWSSGVLARELSHLYAAFLARQSSPLPELEFQYADVARWQRQCLTSEALRPDLAFWKEHLGPTPPVLRLPTDYPRPATQSFRGASHAFTLSPSLRAHLTTLALREGCTLFTTLLAVFATALHRYAAQPDVILGIPVANRTRRELEGLIGPFINVLPLRLRMGGDPSYQELLARVQSTALEAYDHQEVPFEQLIETIQPPRDPSHPALRQVAFSFQNAAGPLPQLPGLELQRIDVDPGVARLDLTLFMWEEADGLAGRLEYNTDLFEPATAVALVDYLEALLVDITAHPERPTLPLPAALAERRERWLRQQATEARTADAPVPPQVLDELLERSNLTEHQLSFWFAQQIQPEVELYFESATATFFIEGELEPHHFQRAWQTLVERSESLRSIIDVVDGVPCRRVLSGMESRVMLEDLSGRSPETLQDWLRDRARRRLRTGDQLFDCALVKAEPQRWVWFLKLHHIIADAHSLSLVFAYMAEFYLYSQEGRLQQAPMLPRYQEYVEHARRLRHSEAYAKAKAYWQTKLERSVSLPAFYRSDTAASTSRTERLSHTLDVALSDQLRRWSTETGLLSPAVPFMTALLAYVHRLTGETVLRLGTPLYNRSEPFQSTIGLFMTALPLQVQIDEGETFASLARKVQVELFQAARYTQYPVSHRPDGKLYDVYFNFQNVGFDEFCGMRVRFELGHSGHANESMTLQVRDFSHSGLYTLDFDLRHDAFGPEQRERSVQHYANILGAMLTSPEQPLHQASMLSPEELHTQLVEWNRSGADYPHQRGLHQLIEDQVERTPEAVALMYEDARYTYRELERHANQLAHYLRRLGVGPDVRVAVHMHRSLDLVVALLGILKAGGAYVPLDPDYPRERLAFMLADSGAQVLLTQRELQDALPTGGVSMLSLDDELRERLVRESDERPPCPITPRNLAYVLYTSGSTGRPKGVAIEHQSICNRLLWMQEAYGLSPDDRVLQKTPFSFDVSVWEFFWPLQTGACLVVARPGGHQDGDYLVETIHRYAITTLHFVPSMLQVFLENQKVEMCQSLVRVFCSGEALPAELVKRFHNRLGVALHNLYGPTEAAVDVTFYACEREHSPSRIPIGRPIANTQIYLLDRHMNPVPVGIAGELHIGGINLARGYLNRPDLTAEKFVCHPFSGVPGARLYKTGDLARYREDGQIEYLDRVDHQVKLRGFRIELGEIEMALSAHPDVREAAVTVREERAGDKRLAGYVVPAAGRSPSSGELRDFLSRTLPEYMVPAALVLLKTMPLTPSGKVDRKLLPKPDWEGQVRSAGYTPPCSADEQVMAAIWADVLGVEQVGLDDHFFALGGNSLLATQVLSNVWRAFLVEVPLRAIFEQPTVARLLNWMAEHLEQQDEERKQLTRMLLREVEQLPEQELEALLATQVN